MDRVHSGAVAAALDVKRSWVHQMIKDGICRAQRDVPHPGHWYVFTKENILELLIARDLRTFGVRKDAIVDMIDAVTFGGQKTAKLTTKTFELLVQEKYVSNTATKVLLHAFAWQSKTNAEIKHDGMEAARMSKIFSSRKDPETRHLRWFVQLVEAMETHTKSRRARGVKVTTKGDSPAKGSVVKIKRKKH